jgi:hypothetical protein
MLHLDFREKTERKKKVDLYYYFSIENFFFQAIDNNVPNNQIDPNHLWRRDDL